MKLDGNALGMTLDASGSTLYMAQDNADQIALINTSTKAVAAKIDARAPPALLGEREDDRRARYTSAATFAVTLSRDGNTAAAAAARASNQYPFQTGTCIVGQRPGTDIG